MKVFSALLASILLSGCEGHFAGERPYNIQSLNGPSEMKVVSVGGTSYLAVLNQNFKVAASTGSLQFYSLATPTAPTRNSALSLELPSNAGDFEVDGTTLYVADRNLKRVLVYDYSAGTFQQRVDASAVPVVITVTDQPQKLSVFTRASDSVKILAVACQTSGLIHFIRTDTLEVVTRSPSSTATPDTYILNGIVGTAFYLNPRRTLNADEDDSVRIPQQPPSFGISSLVYLGGTEQLFVTASALSMAIFSFRLDTFENASNVAWNLSNARDGTNVSGVDYPGTGENGFRAIARDGVGSVFAISRADNSLYQLPRSVFERTKDQVSGDSDAKRNTQGIVENTTTYRVVGFDTTTTDKIFPHLVSMAVNYCPGVGAPPGPNCTQDSAAATIAWVLGLGQKDGDTVQLSPKVYRVDLNTNAVTSTADGVLGNRPQRILWYPDSSLLYVANLSSDTITVLNDDLSAVGTIQN